MAFLAPFERAGVENRDCLDVTTYSSGVFMLLQTDFTTVLRT